MASWSHWRCFGTHECSAQWRCSTIRPSKTVRRSRWTNSLSLLLRQHLILKICSLRVRPEIAELCRTYCLTASFLTFERKCVRSFHRFSSTFLKSFKRSKKLDKNKSRTSSRSIRAPPAKSRRLPLPKTSRKLRHQSQRIRARAPVLKLMMKRSIFTTGKLHSLRWPR